MPERNTQKMLLSTRPPVGTLGARLNCDPIYYYLKEVGRAKLLTAKEEIQLANRIADGDDSARDELIDRNLRLVIKVARSYRYRGLPFSDLIDEGNLGLIHAVEKFDPKKGCRFSTYATWWIRESIERALMNTARTIRLPIHIVKSMNKIRKIYQAISNKLDHEPKIRELAEAAGMPKEELERLLMAERGESMADIHNDNAEEIISIDDSFSTIPEVAQEVSDVEMFEHVVADIMQDCLKSVEYDVIVRRYGLFGRPEETLEEVAEALGLTREKVRQMQMRALKTLKVHLLREGLDSKLIFEEKH